MPTSAFTEKCDAHAIPAEPERSGAMDDSDAAGVPNFPSSVPSSTYQRKSGREETKPINRALIWDAGTIAG
jgi:hypothetical protein